MFNPVSTYRVQFHKDLNFDEFEKIIPYIKQLGIRTVYASPIFCSVPGSVHGYDVTNPHRINPEIGYLEQLQNISGKLKSVGISWIQDIVPNHMALHQDNQWLMDVFEKGPCSAYASYFDIDWQHPFSPGKVILPVLGNSLKEAILNNDIVLVYDKQTFGLKYADSIFPVQYGSYPLILKEAGKRLECVISLLNMETDRKIFDEKLAGLLRGAAITDLNERELRVINSNAELLTQIAEQQYYTFCKWNITDKQINYRRFFTINSLICLNIQEKSVFDEYHSFIKTLSDEGIFQGLRIDHIDGLYDPTEYLHRLRELVGPETYLTVEKITQHGETFPSYWPIAGTTGYDFLAMVNNLFSNPAGKRLFTEFYNSEAGNTWSLDQLVRDKKALIAYHYMSGELENLCNLFINSRLADLDILKKLSWDLLKETIGEFLIQCPVYKYYGDRLPFDDEEIAAIENILDYIKGYNEKLTEGAELLRNVFLIKSLENDITYNNAVIKFYKRCMQFTGPLMAKGVEDTLMYTYNRFIVHNEVGDNPGAFGCSIDAFHEMMSDRQLNRPYSINTTATHDTKRGEDARARLNVLADIAEEWIEVVRKWQTMNASFRENGRPDFNDEYFIYQSLTGSYPFPGQEDRDYKNRFKAYIQKALREAKEHTNWAEPNEKYENQTIGFIDGILTDEAGFVPEFESFLNKISDAGIINSLVQVLLKFTCPGIPDIYQGGELWDFSMVDPDNRRLVNFGRRSRLLEKTSVRSGPVLIKELWDNRYSGCIKQWLITQLLRERSSEQDVWVKGSYLPLKVTGKYKKYILAYARLYESVCYIVTAPLYIAALAKKEQKAVDRIDWEDTALILPEAITGQEWVHLLSGGKGVCEEALFIKDIFDSCPLAIIKCKS